MKKNRIKKLNRVVLTAPIPAADLKSGDVGTVAHVYADGQAYEVEFLALDGHTVAVATVEASQIRPVSAREVTHARELVAT